MLLTQYLQIKASNSNIGKQSSTFNDHFYLKDCGSSPSLGSLVIRLFNHKATIIYYCVVPPEPGKTVFDYRFAILYPDNHYEQGNYIYDYKTTFEDYITQYVQCQIAVLYTPNIPQYKEAVIFNHI